MRVRPIGHIVLFAQNDVTKVTERITLDVTDTLDAVKDNGIVILVDEGNKRTFDVDEFQFKKYFEEVPE